jgi:rubrerythrin
MNTCLTKAYDLEKKGLSFYVDAAGVCPNALARRTLLSLSKEEINHMMMIDEIALSVDKSGAWTCGADAIGVSKVEEELKDFFDGSAKTELAANRESAGVLKKAMELERKSYELYTASMEAATSDNEKRFYDALRKQEEKHYEALENVYYYLTETGDWFAKEENKSWNWMNL